MLEWLRLALSAPTTRTLYAGMPNTRVNPAVLPGKATDSVAGPMASPNHGAAQMLLCSLCRLHPTSSHRHQSPTSGQTVHTTKILNAGAASMTATDVAQLVPPHSPHLAGIVCTLLNGAALRTWLRPQQCRNRGGQQPQQSLTRQSRHRHALTMLESQNVLVPSTPACLAALQAGMSMDNSPAGIRSTMRIDAASTLHSILPQ